MPNGRCPKHWRRTESNRLTALRRHDAKRAAGEPARFYELTEEHRQSFRNARLGKTWSPEVRAAIGASRSESHRKRRDREAIDRNIARANEIAGIRAPRFELLEA
jgi:hypothetical protein